MSATTIEEAIYSILGAADSVTAILGEGQNLRLYPEQAPESIELPFAYYTSPDQVPTITHDGAVASDQYSLEVWVWAADPATAARAGKAIKNALHGYRGSVGSVNIMGAFCRSFASDHEVPVDGSERGLFGASVNFDVFYRVTQ